MRLHKKLGLSGLVGVAALVPVLFLISGASAATHGIGFQKGCNSPTKVGDPVVCHYTITNNNFTNASLDTVTINSLADVTHAAAGDTPPTNILGNLELFKTFGNATCTASSGTGTFADPWIGTTSCTLPGGNVVSGPRLGLWSEIQSKDHNGYVVQPADYNIDPVNHSLADDAALGWKDVCDIDPQSCNTNQQSATAPSATLLVRRVSQTATDIHNAAHAIVTTVAVGTTVHDFITVTSTDPDPGNPIPHGGNVLVEWFTNGTCAAPAAASATVGPVNAAGQFDATGFSQTPLVAGHYAFRAHYLGDGTYDGSDGPCEPLTVVDARISITPNGTNRVGATHTFTATVHVNDGNGETLAPDGTLVSFTIDSDTASSLPNPPTSCTTIGGSCTTSISSATTGVTVVSAHTTLSVGGVSLTRHTDTTHGSSGPATKTWVNAKIAITPDGTNRIGAAHTFTVTLMKDLGDGAGFVAFSGAHVNFTLSDTLGAVSVLNAAASTCDDAGPNTNAAGQCTIVFTSNSTGKVTGNASWTGTLGTPSPFTVSTDGIAPNSGPATKTFVDAKIAITPDGTNRVGAAHTFTVTLMKDLGDGAGFVAFSGAHVNFTLSDTLGAVSVLNAAASTCDDAGPNTDAAGQCTIVFTSNSTGKVTGNASWTGTLGTPSPFTVSTNGVSPNSGPAVKTFVDAKIAIAPDATNRVGAPHTFTVTLMKDLGDGAGFVAFSGAHVNFTLTDTLGAVSVLNAAASTCDDAGPNTDAAGQCTIVFTSNSTGKVTGNASWTGTLGTPSPFTVSTNGVAPNSGPAVKTFVDAKIAIAPDATNRVGAPHTFTVTLSKDTGDGTGFHAAAGEHVSFTLTDTLGAVSVLNAAASTCDDAGANTNAAGQCTIVFTSNSTGKVTGNASSTLSVGGVSITVSTNGASPNSGPAVKTFVDAKIAIAPDATNRVGAPHTFTVTLSKDTGDGTGFHAAAGEHVDFTLTNSNGAVAVLNAAASTCDDAGANTDAAGQCTIVFTSNSTGKVTGNATSTLSVGGVSITVSTNGASPNSGPAVKTFVNAKIEIAPNATNEVGAPHTFTVTLSKDIGDGTGFHAAPGEHVDFTLTNSNGAGFVLNAALSTCDDAGANTNAAGQCTIVFTSPTPGKVTGHASSTLSVGGVSITVATDGVAPNSGDAVKTFVDANIQITPQNATNPVNTNHTLIGHVNINDGQGGPYVDAPNGTVITFSLVNSNGATAAFVGPNSCTVTNGLGSCTVIINSSTTGSTTIKATTTLSVGGVTLTRTTGDGKLGDSADANKNWAAAKITIAPDATNEVNAPHTFTVTLSKDTGGGFGPAAGEHVDFTLTNSNGAGFVLNAAASTCDNAGANTDAAGQCVIVFTSPTGGKVTGHATATLLVGGASITVSTDGVAPNSGDAVKTFVDANIQITPNGTNRVGATHTFTGHVNINAGDGLGFVNAPAGTQISFTIDNGPGAFTSANPCTVAAGGSCTIDLSSAVTGVTTVSAHTTLSVGGISLTRHTNGVGANSGPATKTWVNAKISIAPNATNEIGAPHTFTVTLQKDVGDGAGFVAAPGEHVDVTLTDSNGAAHTAPTGTCTNAGANTNAAGQCTITFTSPTAGKVTGHATSTLVLGPPPPATVHVETDGVAPNSGDAVKTFVDANIQINPQTANNPVSTNHTLTGHVNVNAGGGAGYVNAPDGTVITFSITNSGGASASFVGPNNCTTAGGTGSCTVVISSSTTGTTTVKATTTVSVGGVALTRTTGDGKLGDSADANKTWSDDTVRTDVHDAAHNVITSANGGDIVHDKVEVAKAAGTTAGLPNPTGNVTFNRFDNLTCAGNPASAEVVALTPGTPSTAESAAFTVAGDISYQAVYAGDANYPSHTGACEPLPVNVTVPCPAGVFAPKIEANGDLSIKYDQFPAPNDNSYGVNAVGWGTKGHTFGNLVGSDHAGVTILNASGTVLLDFSLDYITATANANVPGISTVPPSGYASRGPFGGDGGINVGTLTPADISWDTSLARNLNGTMTMGGTWTSPTYFAGGVQTVGTGVANLLVDSPPTGNTTDDYNLTPAAAAAFNKANGGSAGNPADSAEDLGWNFHDTYFATIKASKLASLGLSPANFVAPTKQGDHYLCPALTGSQWCAQPNEDELHNSPAKPCPCPTPVDPNPTLDVHNNGNGTTTITYTQSLALNDNSYGTGTDASWGGKTHTFSNLLGSDKANFVLKNGNGVVVNNFTIDYISAKAGTPSGYGSLGAGGGDGSLSVGPAPLSWTTSLDDDMNLVCPPPAGPWTTNSPSSPGPDPACAGWDFRSIYKVTVSNAIFGASGIGDVTVPLVHNSPSKPLACPATGGGGSQCNFTIMKKEVKDRQVKITIRNNGTVDEIIQAINLTWPSATNGTLKKIKLDGDTLYDKPDIAGGTANLTAAQLGDQNKRKIKKGQTDVLTFEFEKNASTNLANYTGTISFGPNCTLTILP